MSKVNFVKGRTPNSLDGTYFISVGQLSKRYTLRICYQERLWIKDEEGVASSPGYYTRDYHVRTLAKDYDRALTKVSEYFENNPTQKEVLNVYVQEHTIYKDSDRNNIDHSLSPFGKYKGIPVYEIQDKKYLSWLAYESNVSDFKSHDKFRDHLDEHLENIGMDTSHQHRAKIQASREQEKDEAFNNKITNIKNNEWIREGLTHSLLLESRVTGEFIKDPKIGDKTDLIFEYETKADRDTSFLTDMATKLFIEGKSIVDLSLGQRAGICKEWSKFHSGSKRAGTQKYIVQAKRFTEQLKELEGSKDNDSSFNY